MGKWVECIRQKGVIKNITSNSYQLSRNELCRRVGMSVNTYRDVAAGIHPNLVNYLRAAIECMEHLSSAEKEKAEKEFLELLKRSLFDKRAAEPPYIA